MTVARVGKPTRGSESEGMSRMGGAVACEGRARGFAQGGSRGVLVGGRSAQSSLRTISRAIILSWAGRETRTRGGEWRREDQSRVRRAVRVAAIRVDARA